MNGLQKVVDVRSRGPGLRVSRPVAARETVDWVVKALRPVRERLQRPGGAGGTQLRRERLVIARVPQLRGECAGVVGGVDPQQEVRRPRLVSWLRNAEPDERETDAHEFPSLAQDADLKSGALQVPAKRGFVGVHDGQPCGLIFMTSARRTSLAPWAIWPRCSPGGRTASPTFS